MALLTFLVEAVLISLSGVMAPGPITAVTVARGNESPHAGALVAIGHGIVEFPLMISIFYGLGSLRDQTHVEAVIALVGGVFLVVMGVSMLRSVGQAEVRSGRKDRPPVVDGILLSVGNPYFLVWWATVGATLTLRSVSFGVVGFLAFALAHWLCDFGWSYFLSAVSFRGGQLLGRRFQRSVLAICGVVLLLFGGRFIVDGAGAFL